MLLPRGLCTCCSVCLECSVDGSLTSSRFTQIATPPSLPLIILHALCTLIPHAMLYIFTSLVYCLPPTLEYQCHEGGDLCPLCPVVSSVSAKVPGTSQALDQHFWNEQRSGGSKEKEAMSCNFCQDTRLTDFRRTEMRNSGDSQLRKQKNKKELPVSFHFQKKDPLALCLCKTSQFGESTLMCSRGEGTLRRLSHFLDSVKRLKVTQSRCYKERD